MNAIKSKIVAFWRANSIVWARLSLLAASIFLLIALYHVVAYTVPMHTGDFPDAAQSGAGNVTLAYYDGGMAAYQAKDYVTAQQAFSQGYSTLTDNSGQIPQSEQKQASDFQLMIGNSLFYQGKIQEATEAYKQALRHNPDNLTAKYNLELIANQPAGGGGPGGKVPAAGKGPKKGI